MRTISYRSEARKAELPPGPWLEEPDKVQWPDLVTGLPCLAVRGPLSCWCGYVGLPPGHPLHGRGYVDVDEHVDVHGGLTFADFCMEDEPQEHAVCHIPGPGEPERVWWFGFDCGHFMDLIPRHITLYAEVFSDSPRLWKTIEEQQLRDVYRDLPYVQAECAHLARQLARPTLSSLVAASDMALCTEDPLPG